MLTQIGLYQLRHQLGSGGMATVWYAENALGKEFAIKILKPELMQYPQAAERFRNEAKIMVSLRHPNIRQVYDYYEDETTMAIIMEYLQGSDLFEYGTTHQSVPESQVVTWFESILDAVGYVHQKNYFHRDIKPSNLFLTDDGQVKVMDFGIAKLVDSDLNLTVTSTAIGSPQYMSPEQIMTPKQVDYRTDIYSLGVTLYALLSGHKPYDDSAGSVFTIHREIIQTALPWLRGVSDKVNHVIQKATQKSPVDRFQTCLEFKRMLTMVEEPTQVYRAPAGQSAEWYSSESRSFGSTGTAGPNPSSVPPPVYGQVPPIPVYGTTTSPPHPQARPIIMPSGGQSINTPPNPVIMGQEPAAQRPGNWVGGAIFVILFCFWPFGIASLVFGIRVNPAFDRGDYASALANASKAKNCFWIGLFLAPISWFYGFGLVSRLLYDLM
ncbi:protein kinase domain-containing protein [Spirosoma panaciterrae]|uniref:protein kinase domain-containing protein n=1 Tax=Spirosoma panaciterrae TaxID=496058 RepID=UPI000A04D61A|nr:protein kinase [Spirosoma panaciterrae]